MLDTLKFAKRLQEAGFTPPQAEALWEAIEGTVATKEDIALLRQGTKQDIDLLRQEMIGRFQELEARMDGRFKEFEASADGRFKLVYWMVGFNLAFTVAVLVKLLTG